MEFVMPCSVNLTVWPVAMVPWNPFDMFIIWSPSFAQFASVSTIF